MAKNTKPKRAQRDVAAPANEPGNDQLDTHSESRITQLTDLDADLTALADMTLAQMRARWRRRRDSNPRYPDRGMVP